MTDGHRIMLIRHAEKPLGGHAGVSWQGQADDASLSVRGWMRAGALVRFFAPLDGRGKVPHVEAPRRLVAAAPSPARPSTRPHDTLQPLADALGLPIEPQADDPAALADFADALRRRAEPVLVCWRHDSLPALANALLQSPLAPARWPEDRFDLVWVIERSGFSGRFHQVPQQVLADDRAQAIPKRVSAKRAASAR